MTQGARDTEQAPAVRREGERLVLPGLATAHSHAFQRALRGRTHRPGTRAGSFWSWRALMYELAGKLDPDDVRSLSKLAFAELAMAGVTAVGEFHYVHHAPDGSPYDDRIAMAAAAVEAAREVGLRVSLLRVLYHRAGAGRAPEGAQKRFCDGELDDALADVEHIAKRFADDPLVSVGVAPHSVRAVPRSWLEGAAQFTRDRGMPLHVHVAEQRREVRECLAEHGLRPLELLLDAGAVDGRFVGVHVTHLSPEETRLLGEARGFACICRTTERDLGDGLADAAALREAGARLCTGVDSHAVSDPFEEARAIELDDRSRAEARHVAATAPELLAAATREGYHAIGLGEAWREDRVALDVRDPSVACAGEDLLDDAVMFGATAEAVREVDVAGQALVRDGRHPKWDAIVDEAAATLRKLGLL